MRIILSYRPGRYSLGLTLHYQQFLAASVPILMMYKRRQSAIPIKRASLNEEQTPKNDPRRELKERKGTQNSK
jgi:hypothetical protein